MPKKRFLIAPLKSGLQNNVEPFLIPDDALDRMENMYLFRSRWRKRFGGIYTYPENKPTAGTEQLYSRMRYNIGTVAAHALPTGASLVQIGQMFSVDDDMFTVFQVGAGVLTLSTNAGATATIDTTVNPNTVVFTGEPAGSTVYWYPSLPIMGIAQFEQNEINQEPTYVFDTKYAYTFSDGWERSAGEATNMGESVWTGDNADFFSTASWRGDSFTKNLLFVSNFHFTDGAAPASGDSLRYIEEGPNSWTFFTPRYDSVATDVIFTARIIIPFKDRLLLFNVVESDGAILSHFPNRLRFSQNGDPTDQTLSFREDLGGRGGFIDAPTEEQIIGAEFLRDRLIVYCERSSWEIVYTGNEIVPFRWQKINTTLGAESSFSLVPFDEVVLGVGDVGIHACSGSSVTRVDDKIPDFVFSIRNESDGVKRVHGIRDYDVEQVYWTFPDIDASFTYPRNVLVYDYRTGNWALFDDTITAFGYFQSEDTLTWGDANMTWGEASFTWGAGTNQSFFRTILAGNQQGYVFLVKPKVDRNAGVLQITAITGTTITCQSHNLSSKDFVLIENANGVTYNTDIYKVVSTTTDTITINESPTGTYEGGGTLTRVSKPLLKTKQYNFMADMGTNMAVDKIDFMVSRTDAGKLTIDSYPSSSMQVTETHIMDTSPYALYPLESSQSRLWHSIYPSITGQVCQFEIYLSDEQMLDRDNSLGKLEIHALMFHVATTSAQFQ